MSETQVNPAHMNSLFDVFEYTRTHSAFYKKHFAAFAETKRADFDITALPFTTKDDLSMNNSDFCCIPRSQIAEYVTTSGTSGKPVTIYLSKNDLLRLAKNEKESFELAGAQAGDLFQLMTTIDKQFMAGLAYFLGVQELNAGIIRIGPGVPALQWNSILENQPDFLIAVPSFLINLIDYAKENGIDVHASSVKAVICIGEPVREEALTENVLAKRIHQDWNIELFSTYASTEMGAAFTECFAHQGGHLNEALLHLEVLDDEGNEVPSGSKGEIVVTTLGVEGTPLMRYKTGDVAMVYREPCLCGRTSPRVGPILGRKNQMIKFKGTTIFPNSIYEIFDSKPSVSCYKVEIAKDYMSQDTITVLLEKRIEGTEVMATIVDECRAKLRVVPHFVFLETDYLRSQVYKNHMRKPEKIVFK